MCDEIRMDQDQEIRAYSLLISVIKNKNLSIKEILTNNEDFNNIVEYISSGNLPK